MATQSVKARKMVFAAVVNVDRKLSSSILFFFPSRITMPSISGFLCIPIGCTKTTVLRLAVIHSRPGPRARIGCLDLTLPLCLYFGLLFYWCRCRLAEEYAISTILDSWRKPPTLHSSRHRHRLRLKFPSLVIAHHYAIPFRLQLPLPLLPPWFRKYAVGYLRARTALRLSTGRLTYRKKRGSESGVRQ
ncbi:hypothetical protein MSAN_02217000 [Mycena sanguinolenta]|uniref:Uncharacterized protein n=1 Tax=Mycena sanguinolenta TaxID=230812 RepID=A0A8H6XAG4_9AGAR|nr:hypothetical protein MSAN_02217000 [Mycena sanguinolenta]